jgi:hypothetical protein
MKIKKEKKGMALITILLLTVLLIIMTVSMVFISTQHLRLMGNVEGYDISLKAAEAGAEYALAQLNSDPLWGDPNTADVDKTLSNGSKFSITFKTGNDYYSYNNLLGNTEHNRTGFFQGKVPAYTAEIISIGESPGKLKKILRVVYIRDDRIPANVLAKGKIFCKSGKIFFTGKDPDKPGWVYSNWKDPNNDPTNYSIYSDKSNPDSTVDAKGGIVSSRGTVDLNIYKPGDVYIDENTAKKLESTDIDIGKLLSNAHSDNSTVKTSCSYRVTSFNGIKNDAGVMAGFIHRKYGNPEEQLKALCYPTGLSGSPGGSGETCYVSKGIGSAGYSASGEQESWFSNTSGNGNSWNKISGSAKGTENYETYTSSEVKDPNGDPTGEWEWKSAGSGSRPLSSGNLTFSLTEDPVNGGSCYCIKGSEKLFDQEIGVIRIGQGAVQWPPVLGSATYDIVKNNAIFPDPKKTMDGFRVEKTVTGSDVKYSVSLENDIYADAANPTEIDYNLTCNDVQDKAFSIKREYSMDNSTTGEKVLKTPLDMNGHNIYSDGHTSIGMIIKNAKTDGGMVVSGGKLSYLYGYEGANLIAVSKDDLYLPTSHEEHKYNLKGYLYTENDLVIESIDKSTNLKTKGTVMTASGARMSTNCVIEGDEPLKNLRNITSSEELLCKDVSFIEIENGSNFIVPDRAIPMTYTSSTGGVENINFKNYQISYKADGSGNVSIDNISKLHTFTCIADPNLTINEYVSIPYAGGTYNPTGAPGSPGYDPTLEFEAQEVTLNDFTDEIGCSDPNVVTNIGQLLYDNYLNSNVTLTGQIVTNDEKAGSSDNNGDENVIIDPGNFSKFNSINDIVDISALVNARKGDFTIRRMCWEVIK